MPPFGGVAVLVSAASDRMSVFRNLRGDGRKKIRLTKKTNVRKRFGADPWEQPIPKRWRAAALRVGYFVLGIGCLHGNWLIFRLHSPTLQEKCMMGFQ